MVAKATITIVTALLFVSARAQLDDIVGAIDSVACGTLGKASLRLKHSLSFLQCHSASDTQITAQFPSRHHVRKAARCFTALQGAGGC